MGRARRPAGPLRSPRLRRPDPPAPGLPRLRHLAPTGAGDDAAGPRCADYLASPPAFGQIRPGPRRAHPTSWLVPLAPAVPPGGRMPFPPATELLEAHEPADLAELPGGLVHPSRAPAQRHLPIAPVLDVDGTGGACGHASLMINWEKFGRSSLR